jgi:DNA mismatch repair protein MutS2
VDEVTAREARRLVEEGIKAEAEALAAAESGVEAVVGEPSGEIPVGSRVRLASGGRGRLVERRADGRLVVVAGAVKLVLDPEQVTAAAGSESPRRELAAEPAPQGGAVPAPPLELDLRGLTADEAEARVIGAIDAAVLADHPFLRIIHGKGTGALRERIQRVVAADRRIARFGFAPANRGGTGVTVVEFTP